MSAATIRRFYEAFAALDADTMQACYAEDARFDDEVFSLAGRERVGGMWRMLCERARQGSADVWKLEFEPRGETGAFWEVRYRFGPGGRMVVNRIEAEFEFDAEGRIRRHRDRFDFARWARQALGLPGWLFGGTGWLRAKARAQAGAQLDRFLARRPAAGTARG